MSNNPYDFTQPGNPYGANQLRPVAPMTGEMKHSGLGIASFIMALGMGVLEFVLFIAAGIMETRTPGGIDENSPAAIVLGLALIGGLLLDMLAVGLGIAGLLQPRRKKVFAILGVIIGTMILLGVIGLIGLGMSLQAVESARAF